MLGLSCDTADICRLSKLLHDFQACQPCAVSGTLQASLLYGQEQGIYLDNNGKLNMGLEGLVLRKV